MANSKITFSNGKAMPLLGLGTWMITDPSQLETALDSALEAGCRHFDTASAYGNEQLIGNVLKRWFAEGKITREELFITTKGMNPLKVMHFLRLSLERLQLNYVDLYLIHVPIGVKYVSDDIFFPTTEDGKIDFDMETDLIATWKAMEGAFEEGLAQSIGVSNFNEEQIQRIFNAARVPPVNLQVEMHAYFQQRELRELCAKLGVTVTAFAPLGSPGRNTLYEAIELPFSDINLLQDSVVLGIADKLGKTPAQVLIKFILQLNVAVLCKSINPERIRQNFEVSDFTLSSDDVSSLEALDKGVKGRTFTWDFLPGHELMNLVSLPNSLDLKVTLSTLARNYFSRISKCLRVRARIPFGIPPSCYLRFTQ